MAKVKKSGSESSVSVVDIPQLKQGVVTLRLVGDTPLMINNKMSVARDIAEQYQGSGLRTKRPKAEGVSVEEQYARAFYTLPSSPEPPPSPAGLYGVPTSGIKKCLTAAIRSAGFTDNTTIGLIGKSFRVLPDEGGLSLIRHNGFVRDERPVNIGSGQKTVPNMRCRPLFTEWEIHIRVIYNTKILSPEQIVNLAMHAGQYIGLCELRAQKNQGECGGFMVASENMKLPGWTTDKYWGIQVDRSLGFRVIGNGKPKRRRRNK